MNGKVLLLLSGGIDSPVAAYSLLRRGIKVECIHFAAPPYTSEAVIDKLKDLIGVLNVYQPKIKINVVPFTKLQESIYKYVAEPYCITIMRRMMLRIATKVAKKCRALALATGESIGQVASQTLVSIQTINDVTNFPILRPLAVEDKVSIMNTARRIGTYEISIRPYEDCCTIFKPKKPKTKPKIEECEFFEKKWDWASQVDECVSSITSILMEDGIEQVEEGEAL
jgi:thiamine biosynthesis protein ThiI